MTKIVIYDDLLSLDQALIQTIQEVAPEATVVAPSKENLVEELTDAEIFFGFCPPEIIQSTNSLRWIQMTSAGMDKIPTSKLDADDLTICNASGVHAPQVVELAWTLTLAIANRLPKLVQNQQQHHWSWEKRNDLEGSTAGIIGLGGIGRRYARVASAFGMHVLAVDLHQPPKPDDVKSLWPINRLDEMIQSSDVVMISCPYTPETHHLINRNRLALMQPTAFLINIARGEIIDEEAMVEALCEGRIAGAGIDVTKTEPLPEDSPLWDVPNLIITPHSAGISPYRTQRLLQFFCSNLQRYLAGDPLHNVVDRQKGYPVPK